MYITIQAENHEQTHANRQSPQKYQGNLDFKRIKNIGSTFVDKRNEFTLLILIFLSSFCKLKIY
jgi:hypothetical protein